MHRTPKIISSGAKQYLRMLRGQACYVRARDAYAHGRKREMNEELTLPIVSPQNDVRKTIAEIRY